MESRVKDTIARHNKGYNCAQAVACSYCDLFGMDEKTAFRAMEAFGAGMGGMDATCGALSGAVFLAGLKYSDGKLEGSHSKGRCYQCSREMTERFHKKCGSLVCRELRGFDGGPGYPCEGCIRAAAEIVEDLLF